MDGKHACWRELRYRGSSISLGGPQCDQSCCRCYWDSLFRIIACEEDEASGPYTPQEDSGAADTLEADAGITSPGGADAGSTDPGTTSGPEHSGWAFFLDTSHNFAEPSLAVDSHGGLHVAYRSVTGDDSFPIRYAYCSSNCSNPASWRMTDVGDAGGDGAFPSLVLDSQDRPRLAWFHENLMYGEREYWFAKCDSGCTERSGAGEPDELSNQMIMHLSVTAIWPSIRKAAMRSHSTPTGPTMRTASSSAPWRQAGEILRSCPSLPMTSSSYSLVLAGLGSSDPARESSTTNAIRPAKTPELEGGRALQRRDWP
jgi:hypothetical protein